MTQINKLVRSRPELADFLKSRRERITPTEMGLPLGHNRRTRGLRREEVAALSGVGLTWYTWLEQGRDISVSSRFLEKLTQIFRLSAFEREHLFLLAQNRLPAENALVWNSISPIIQHMMDDLDTRPCYAWNLKWDVIAWNKAADLLFKFSSFPTSELNIIWLLFTKPYMRQLIIDWDRQACDVLSSFRRDIVRVQNEPDAYYLINQLKRQSSEFLLWWDLQNVHAVCQGLRDMHIEQLGDIRFEHTTVTIDLTKHLKMTYYRAISKSENFDTWVIGKSQKSDHHIIAS